MYFQFLINKSIPLPLKKYGLISFILSLVIYYAPLSLVQIRAYVLKLKKLLTEDFIGDMDLNLAILMLVSMILLLFQLSVLYLNIRCFRKWKNSSNIINYLTNNIPTMSHYSWT